MNAEMHAEVAPSACQRVPAACASSRRSPTPPKACSLQQRRCSRQKRFHLCLGSRGQRLLALPTHPLCMGERAKASMRQGTELQLKHARQSNASAHSPRRLVAHVASKTGRQAAVRRASRSVPASPLSNKLPLMSPVAARAGSTLGGGAGAGPPASPAAAPPAAAAAAATASAAISCCCFRSKS